MNFRRILLLLILATATILLAYPIAIRWQCKSALVNDDLERLRQLVSNRKSRATDMLVHAFALEKKQAFDLLLKAGAKPDGLRHGRLTLVHSAAANDDSYWLERLLNFGANPNYRRVIRQISPLSHAIERNVPGNVLLLIDAGAEINATTNRGDSMLSLAWSMRHGEIAKILLDAGAAINPPCERYESFVNRYQRMIKTTIGINERTKRDEHFIVQIHEWFRNRNLDLDNATWDESQGDFGSLENPFIFRP